MMEAYLLCSGAPQLLHRLPHLLIHSKYPRDGKVCSDLTQRLFLRWVVENLQARADTVCRRPAATDQYVDNSRSCL